MSPSPCPSFNEGTRFRGQETPAPWSDHVHDSSVLTRRPNPHPRDDPTPRTRGSPSHDTPEPVTLTSTKGPGIEIKRPELRSPTEPVVPTSWRSGATYTEGVVSPCSDQMYDHPVPLRRPSPWRKDPYPTVPKLISPHLTSSVTLPLLPHRGSVGQRSPTTRVDYLPHDGTHSYHVTTTSESLPLHVTDDWGSPSPKVKFYRSGHRRTLCSHPPHPVLYPNKRPHLNLRSVEGI